MLRNFAKSGHTASQSTDFLSSVPFEELSIKGIN